MAGLTVERYCDPKPARLGVALRSFERSFRYPLGDDAFRIDHGAEYFAFFERMGRAEVYLASRGDGVVGSLVAVYRTDLATPCWYLADLKVDARGAGAMVGARLLRAWQRHVGDAPAYAVSMDEGCSPSRLTRLLVRLGVVRLAGSLRLFTVPPAQRDEVGALLHHTWGGLQMESLAGIKDIQLERLGERWPLVHVGPPGRREAGASSPSTLDASVTWMGCLPAEDVLWEALLRLGARPAGSASLLHRNNPGVEPGDIRTSEI